MSSFFIGGGRDDGNGGMLRRLDAAMLLDYDVDEIGAVLPHKLNLKVKGREVHEELVSHVYPHWRLAASTTKGTGSYCAC